ncbi:MAG: bifunctional methylenetetrahydrofolate dehydrogenase/methenyltetrahydrofolate cyclohydrolase [Clostridiales bacterium]|nr:MAG: bifunctional methylenetetrahydrofolate dehydrogenase/methenyltetrahydrofolate cyclohydrolase [Clostridiales bacterium]
MILDGNALAKNILSENSRRIARLKSEGRPVGLAIVLVGDDASSKLYVNMVELFEYKENYSSESVIKAIENLNDDARFSGIIVQFPLPKGIDENGVREAIAPHKDVDAAGTRNMGQFYSGAQCFKPCTPLSMLALLKSCETDLTGKDAVVIGRSNVVGKPIANMLLSENMTVTICHSRTEDLASHIKRADVLMSATGIKHLVTSDMLKPGAVVVDAGIIVEKDAVYGDVDPTGIAAVAKAYTPVPGGVGPVTIAKLIDNVVDAAER